jgi:hypothetical protein
MKHSRDAEREADFLELYNLDHARFQYPRDGLDVRDFEPD